MANIYQIFGSDAKAEREGVVIDYGNGGWVKIARAGGANLGFSKALERLSRPHRRAIQLETLPDDVGAKIFHEVYAETVVLDWNFTDREGKKLPLTRERIIQAFEELPNFFDEVRSQANRQALFREIETETDAKN